MTPPTLHRGVRPVSLAHLRVVERKPVDLYARLAANDRGDDSEPPLPSEARFLVWGALAAAVVVGMLLGVLS